jgi:hypothetical protein
MIAVLLLALPSPGLGQSALEDAIKQYSGDAVKGYIQPVADMFGANMHAGYFQTASIPKTGFVFSFDIIGMASLVGDAQKTYTANAPPGFAPTTFQTATVFGGKGTEVSNTSSPSLRYKGSDGIFNTSVFPLAVPQVTIGSIYGTVGVVRFVALPKFGDDKVPTVSLWGVGLRHSVSQYFKMIPLDLAAGIYYDRFKAGDIVDFSGLMIGVHASKTFSILTVYGGLAWEKSSLNLKYTSTDPSVPLGVDISLDGANSVRGTVGVKLALGVFKIFADANVGSVTNFSGGIGFGY